MELVRGNLERYETLGLPVITQIFRIGCPSCVRHHRGRLFGAMLGIQYQWRNTPARCKNREREEEATAIMQISSAHTSLSVPC